MMTEQSILEQKLSQIFNAIKNDPANAVYTAQKIEPLYAAAATAKILLIGQAPGKKHKLQNGVGMIKVGG